MKKKIFLSISLLSLVAFADDRESSYIYKCMQALQPQMQEFSYEIPGRSTIVTMFKENLNGTFARKGESAANEGVISSGALLIEKSGLRVCPFDWNSSESVVFRIEDGAGKMKLGYKYGERDASGNINCFVQKSRFALVSSQTSGKLCKPVNEAEKSRGQDLLKKLILSAIKKDMITKGSENYQAPIYCTGIVGITAKDISDLTQPNRAPAVEPQETQEVYR